MKPSHTYLGYITLLASALFFYLATFVMRLSLTSTTLSASEFTLARFLLGFLCVSGYLLYKQKWIKVRSYHLISGRAFFNGLGIFFFYKAVEVTTLASANILNMTYPIFITFIAWFVFKDDHDWWAIIMTFVSFVGI